ncbi:MAG: SMP-30/gluconolactonase/LRE family protein [Planctomycetota bacterium]
MTIDAAHLARTRCTLGEGPIWHDDALWFVDIEARTLCRWHEGDLASFDATQRIGFATPTAQGDWIVGLQEGLARWSPGEAAPRVFARPEPGKTDNRFNDGKADPTGRLYAGTMHMPAEEPMGTLYRLDDATPIPVISSVTISNGLAWHTPARSMYYIDTPTRRITRFDWSPDSGDITSPSTVIEFDPELGSPDGMTIDAAGNLYVAMWGGSAVQIVDPRTGSITGTIRVDAPHVTSCAFGGPDLTTLFITTARVGLSPSQLETHPRSGDLFAAIVPGAQGLPTTLVGGKERLP